VLNHGKPGGPRIFIKRDDLTSLGLGGNKLRNLEFRLARTMAEQADTVIVGLDCNPTPPPDRRACNRLGLKRSWCWRGRSPTTSRATC
jgi:D-cysteine desulfhydrase/L-cysteate sulfo-lyase